MLTRALESVSLAAVQVPGNVPVMLMPVVDHHRAGAATTRTLGLMNATTEWVAFLDDDDVMDQPHLATLFHQARAYNADYLWSRFRIGYPDGRYADGPAPLGPGSFDQWDDAAPAQTTVTTLVRTELARDVGGFLAKPQPPCWDDPTGTGLVAAIKEQEETGLVDGNTAGEDWRFTLACRAAGGVFRHVPEVTWTWNHHGANTSGQPNWR